MHLSCPVLLPERLADTLPYTFGALHRGKDSPESNAVLLYSKHHKSSTKQKLFQHIFEKNARWTEKNCKAANFFTIKSEIYKINRKNIL